MAGHDDERVALEVCAEALARYGEDSIAISFNGGKDCTALLELYAIALERWHAQQHGTASETSTHRQQRYRGRPIKTVYIFQPDPFAEVEQFIDASVVRYNLALTRIDEKQIREGLTRYLDEHHTIKAILVGTRRTDPYAGELQHFSPTDNGWPPFMRVNPIIDWSYAALWRFLRQRAVPYCVLYDRGYTSLGSVHNTEPNPALRRPNGTYAPAYELHDGSMERAGRLRR